MAEARLQALEGFGEIREIARSGEPDRYLAALLAPAAFQSDLLVLSAFVAEVARIPASVSEALIGEMRLQWWRDAIAGAASGAATGQPVADALADVIRRRALPAEQFVRIIDARSHDLTGEMHGDDRALERHLADCEGAPFGLAAKVLGAETWPAALVASAGVAYGLARGLGRLPALIEHGGFPMSAAALHAAGIEATDLASRPYNEALKAAIERIAVTYRQRALDALREARAGLAQVSNRTRVAGLPLAMVEPYFAAQRSRGFERLGMLAEVAPLSRVWRLASARVRGKV